MTRLPKPPGEPTGRGPGDPGVPQRGFRGADPDVPAEPAPYPDFPLASSERVYDSPWCGLRRDMIDLGEGLEQEYHVFEISNASVVVPVRRDGSIVMIGQHRHPTGRTHWELPAGRIATGESPLHCAQRELLEETGHTSTHFVELPGFFPTNGISAHYAHAFAALDCAETAEPELEATERLVVRAFSPEDVDRLLAAGRIQDAFAALPLFYYRLLAPTLDSTTPAE